MIAILKQILSFKTFFQITFLLSLIGLFVLITDFGYDQTDPIQELINGYYFLVLALGIIATAIRYITLKKNINDKVFIFDAVSLLIIIYIILIHFFSKEAHQHLSFLYNDNWLKFAILLTLIREFAEQKINYKRTLLNPAQLFIASFIGIILIGTFLLMLPNATYTEISYLDALFTSTSAVCVTGLIVVDTGSFFTQFGQTIILLLIQLGGLGILTFASYFSYFFKGGSNYENQLVLSDLTNSQKLSDVFSTLKRILVITFSIEIIGGLLIYTSLNNAVLPTFFERIFFTVFHAVSAFC
ncbi:MAG: potassium transporter TrkG, partial [Lutibacter sp.]